MPEIILITKIKAPVERCFLLSLSVDLHKASTSGTNEEAIAGICSGCMKLNDTVTWRAKHFGFTQELTSKITGYDAPNYFVDEIQKGIFKKLHHRHIFKFENGETVMKDIFDYSAPLGFLGTLAEKLFLTNYLKKFLEERNLHIKRVAEGDEWRKYISMT